METKLLGHRTLVGFFWGGGGGHHARKTSGKDLKTMVYLYFDEIQMFTSLEAKESMVLYLQSHWTHSD